jgi:ribosomal protein L7/L12
MDAELKRILDERLARGEIDIEEHTRLVERLQGSGGKQYAVVLNAPSNSKIETIKVVRESTGAGLKEAKQLVEAAPVLIAEGLDRSGAEAIARNLLDIGARAEVAGQDSSSLSAARQAAAQARVQTASGCLLFVVAALAMLLLLAGVLPAEAASFPR